MIIINYNGEPLNVKIFNNLSKSENPILHMVNTGTKKEYDIEIEDTSTSKMFYSAVINFDGMDEGEFEFEIDGNKGLLRINSDIEVKTYDAGISFKQYEC